MSHYGVQCVGNHLFIKTDETIRDSFVLPSGIWRGQTVSYHDIKSARYGVVIDLEGLLKGQQRGAEFVGILDTTR